MVKKQLTIPEMELLGATLGAAAIQYVEKQLQQVALKKCLWTDSMTVWNWLHNCKDSRFVANRVTKIHEAECEYMFVPTKSNPADIPTRGITGTWLAACTLWWKGPEWLPEAENWPKQPEKAKATETDIILVTEANEAPVEPILDTTRFSSWTKLLRVTATLLKACKRFKSLISSDCSSKSDTSWSPAISANDLKEAEAILVQREQQIAAERLTRACEIEMNEDGFMIFKNRMHKAGKLCHEPIILPTKAHLTQLYVLYVHKKLLHAGGPHTSSSR
uniref:Uncharacterized protein n=1 Tax=Panagrolaimus superbus TaxID=310955 RepID=A0A914YPG2_9BILA